MYDIKQQPYCAVKEPQWDDEAYHDIDYQDLEENGRSYSFFRAQPGDEEPEVKNLYADDEKEKQLQVDMHDVWKWIKAGRLYYAAPRGEILRVIDVGCGYAVWVNELAENKNHEVEGFDASRILPSINVEDYYLYHHDCNDTLPRHEGQKFDLIHVRQMLLCISDISEFAKQCYSSLSSTGCVELSQASLIPEIDDDNLPGFRKWKLAVLDAGKENNIEVNIFSEKLTQAFQAADLATKVISYDLSFTVQNKYIFSVFEANLRAVSLRLLTLGNCSWPQAELIVADAMSDLKKGGEIVWVFTTILALKD